MDPVIKADWVEHLRSGEYPQTDGYLHIKTPGLEKKADRFCCLGVLCEMAVEAGVVVRFGECADGVHGYRDPDSEVVSTHLPNISVKRWAGLQEDQINNLSRMNDEGRSFEYLANVIEQEM